TQRHAGNAVLLLSHNLVEEAGGGVAGLDGVAGPAPLHHAGVGFQVQARPRFAGIVAGAAAAAGGGLWSGGAVGGGAVGVEGGGGRERRGGGRRGDRLRSWWRRRSCWR